jgi:phosphomevalonate kinase|uniref:NET domain-containing protein n=1 Tax=viral metagenome TaxID=1070528 RepID=A0A6C0CKE1_9ZZZZ
MMEDLNILKEKIESLDKFHQIEILKILNQEESCILNENNNGVFINLTNINESVIKDIISYLDYVKKQEKQLTEVEVQKDMLTNTFFKDNKDNVVLQTNEKS